MSEFDTAAQPEEDDRTILVRTPEIKGPSERAPERSGRAAPLSSNIDFASAVSYGNGLNPIVHAANPLLNIIAPLRAMNECENLDDLRSQLVEAVRAFESDLRTQGIDASLIAAARYVLCTFIDETISSTPWGGDGAWATKSLLVAFHNEAWGGEKIFAILQRLGQSPRSNLHVLELIYFCLSLGLEGRYRVRVNGREQLELLRERLRQMINSQRGGYEQDLSLHWRGVTVADNSLMRALPIWVIASCMAVMLFVLHAMYSHWLAHESDPVFARLSGLRAERPVKPEPKVVRPETTSRLAGLLAPDIKSGQLGIVETAERSVLTLQGDGAFASASAEIRPEYEPLIARIGAVLKELPGKVIVIGHTDDQRSFSMLYPSNWALSKARSAAVIKQLVATTGDPARYVVVGRGETEPLVPNDSPENRARNRRVDIVLLAPGEMSDLPGKR